MAGNRVKKDGSVGVECREGLYEYGREGEGVGWEEDIGWCDSVCRRQSGELSTDCRDYVLKER